MVTPMHRNLNTLLDFPFFKCSRWKKVTFIENKISYLAYYLQLNIKFKHTLQKEGAYK